MLRRKLNLFYYNIFRWERYVQYLISLPIDYAIKVVGLGDVCTRSHGTKNWQGYIDDVLNDPKNGFVIYRTGAHITLLTVLVATSVANVISASLRFRTPTFWYYAVAIGTVLSVLMAILFLAPIDTTKYLAAFRRFEAGSPAFKRKSALVTLLIVLTVWGMCIASFAYLSWSFKH